jgi:hypothetical protein
VVRQRLHIQGKSKTEPTPKGEEKNEFPLEDVASRTKFCLNSGDDEQMVSWGLNL